MSSQPDKYFQTMTTINYQHVTLNKYIPTPVPSAGHHLMTRGLIRKNVQVISLTRRLRGTTGPGVSEKKHEVHMVNISHYTQENQSNLRLKFIPHLENFVLVNDGCSNKELWRRHRRHAMIPLNDLDGDVDNWN